jgi:hypothetical protein
VAAQKNTLAGHQRHAVVQSSELWSWHFEGGRYDIAPFGANGTDADESNAAQLWSSVYLAIKEPPGVFQVINRSRMA